MMGIRTGAAYFRTGKAPLEGLGFVDEITGVDGLELEELAAGIEDVDTIFHSGWESYGLDERDDRESEK